MVNTIVISASSDIGMSFLKNRFRSGDNLIGTYRNKSNKRNISNFCNYSFFLDLFDETSLDNFINDLAQKNIRWNRVLFCPCQPYPYKSFFKTKFSDWQNSFILNSINQLKILHKLYSLRSKEAKVLFFAGAGTNGPVDQFSAYCSAKVHLIKMVELLDFENKDISFSILGPGWVNTKTHLLALEHSEINSEKYNKTKEFIENPVGETPIAEVIRSINWIFDQKKSVVGGRNFATAYDPWMKESPNYQAFISKLIEDKNMYKLRRYGNEFFPQKNY